MDRDTAIDVLASKAAELRLEMYSEQTGVLPPEILLALAWEEAILRRYQADYERASVEVKGVINAAKLRCGEQSGYEWGTEGYDYYVNRIVKDDTKPVTMVAYKCKSCDHKTQVVSILDNMAGARPFWTYFIDGINFARHT